MTSRLHYAAVALALVAGAETANAQNVISREITNEPVETIIQRGPTGTVVTRRPLEMPVPRAPITLRSTTVVDPDETTSVEPEETITTRDTVGVSSINAPVIRRRGPAARVAPRAAAHRTATPRAATPRVSVSKQRSVKSKTQVRATTARRAAPAVAARSSAAVQAVAAPTLTPAQRHVIYRTVVEERVVPRTVIERDPFAPPFGMVAGPPRDIFGGRVVTPSATIPVNGPPELLEVETVGVAPAVTQRVVTTTAPNPTLVPGARVPATVPLYAFPETLGARVPAVRQYRYAVMEDRVFLIDPYTNRIVSEIEE